MAIDKSILMYYQFVGQQNQRTYAMWTSDARDIEFYGQPLAQIQLYTLDLKDEGSENAWVKVQELAKVLDLETNLMLMNFIELAQGEALSCTIAFDDYPYIGTMIRCLSANESHEELRYFMRGEGQKVVTVDLNYDLYITAGYAKELVHAVKCGGVKAETRRELDESDNSQPYVTRVYGHDGLPVNLSWEIVKLDIRFPLK